MLIVHRYFVVTAKIVDSKPHSGYRKRIYQDAIRHSALYDIRGPHPSIWYPEASSDLQIALMFGNESNAHQFINCLLEYNCGDLSLLKGKIETSTIVEELLVDQKGIYVHRDDYKFQDSDSPSNTYDDVRSPTEVEYTYDPLQEMRSLENLKLISPGDLLYKCHIAPQAFYKEYAKDLNNILYGSHLFHIYFDGDGKRKPADADLDWGIPPRLKLNFESVGEEVLYQGTRYVQIYVLITFLDPAMARAMEGRWREGTETVGALQFRSFFYTSNIENCINFLKIKCSETETRWQGIDI